MIEIIRSIIIGGIQGISEFLPISSSGHLVLIPYIFKWNYNGLSFDIALHFGTVIAIVIYFWKDWMSLIANAIKSCQLSAMPTGRQVVSCQPKSNDKIENKNVILSEAKNLDPLASSQRTQDDNSGALQYPPNLLWQILVASIPAAILGILLDKYVEKYFHSPLLIASNLIFFGIILWLFDKYSKRTLALKNITFTKSFLVGCAQAIALLPGVSRSGITMTLSRYFGLTRKDAARFSFLLATPAMIGAFLISAKDIVGNDLNLVFFFGVLSSTIFGFLAIKYLLKYLERGNFSVFVWYRIILAVIIVAVYLIR